MPKDGDDGNTARHYTRGRYLYVTILQSTYPPFTSYCVTFLDTISPAECQVVGGPWAYLSMKFERMLSQGQYGANCCIYYC